MFGRLDTFKYDPFGRRIYKSSSSGTSIFAYDGDNLIEETNAAGAAVARYSQGLNIDEPLAMLRSSTTSYYQGDGLGSITSLSNGAGSLAQTYTFDSFGKQTASSGSLTNPLQYTAREYDSETNLYFYRARYYDPTGGRFVSEDPAGFRTGVNFYSYAGNRPTILRDPRGLWASGVGLTGAGNIGIFWRGGGAEGGFHRVTDALGNVGVLDCRGVGIGAVNGVSAGVQVTTLICPNCRSICDMQGPFGGGQAFGGVGATVSAGGGVTLSSSSATISYGLGLGGGFGGGFVGIGGDCTLVWQLRPCPSCPAPQHK